MREFSERYLRYTREGMWGDSQAALEPLAIASDDRVLDVGCGTGALMSVLASTLDSTPIGCDVDRSLLSITRGDGPVVQGDATALPFATDTMDLVTCQALLINLADPQRAVDEFARVSCDRVAVIEPDNAKVSVTSSVPDEAQLEQRARSAFLAGVETDVALGAAAGDLLERAGLTVVATERYDHERRIEPPYTENALVDARRKATGSGLESDRETIIAGGTTIEAFDRLRSDWRAMGREVVEQIEAGTYRRTEVVPFHVTVARV